MGRTTPVAFAEAFGRPQFSPRFLIALRTFCICGLFSARCCGVRSTLSEGVPIPFELSPELGEPAPLPLMPGRPEVEPLDEVPPATPEEVEDAEDGLPLGFPLPPALPVCDVPV